jgi:hypothetical protein
MSEALLSSASRNSSVITTRGLGERKEAIREGGKRKRKRRLT